MLRMLVRVDTSMGSLLENIANKTLLLFLLAATGACLLHQGLAITHRYPLDYGEAPLVDQAMRLGRGENIYRADISSPPYTISNYPPLYVVALAPFIELFGPNFWAGRAISTISALAAALFLALILYELTKDRLSAIFAGLIFLTIPFVVQWSSYLRIDLLALGLSLAGLYLLVRWPDRRWGLLGGGLLLAAAIYTRQSYALAAPAAAFTWLLVHDWRRALALAFWVGGLTMAVFLVLNLLTQGGFFFNIVTANVNEFGMERLEWNLRRFRDTVFVLLFTGVLAIAVSFIKSRSWALLTPYLVGAVLTSLTIGKIGSNVNYFLELCAGLSLAAGFVVAWTRKRQPSHGLRITILALLLFQSGKMLQITLDEDFGNLRQRLAAIDELRELEAVVAAANGPILADEYMGMITLQGRPLVMQPFEVTQLVNAGMWDQTPLLQSIEAEEYALILVHYFPEFPVYRERWTPEMLATIERVYTPAGSLADTRIYRAFSAPEATDTCPQAPWRLPSSGVMGVQWQADGLDFFGWARLGTEPVYAVADGYLTRLPEWSGTVAILHDDPLRPGELVWTYYGNMLNASGQESYVLPDYPTGSAARPVKQGDLLGYQGNWSGRPNFGVWMHVRFAVIQPAEDGSFPEKVTGENMLDPSPYLGLANSPQDSSPGSQQLTCNQ